MARYKFYIILYCIASCMSLCVNHGKQTLFSYMFSRIHYSTDIQSLDFVIIGS